MILVSTGRYLPRECHAWVKIVVLLSIHYSKWSIFRPGKIAGFRFRENCAENVMLGVWTWAYIVHTIIF